MFKVVLVLILLVTGILLYGVYFEFGLVFGLPGMLFKQVPSMNLPLGDVDVVSSTVSPDQKWLLSVLFHEQGSAIATDCMNFIALKKNDGQPSRVSRANLIYTSQCVDFWDRTNLTASWIDAKSIHIHFPLHGYVSISRTVEMRESIPDSDVKISFDAS